VPAAFTCLVLAHVGACSRSEAISTLVVIGLIVGAVVRPWRPPTLKGRGTATLACVVLVGSLTLSGCGGTGGKNRTTTVNRPTTTAKLRIVRPAANEQTGPDTTVEIELQGARVVPQTSGPLRPDEGHIHVSVDGKLVSMAYETTQELHALTPGSHTLQAEFVAADHVPFRNRVTAAVIFQVKT
jgi:hypothetical protein